jgi:hypothetical protein
MKNLIKSFLVALLLLPSIANATALSANKVMQSRNSQGTKSYNVTASATIYAGSMVCLVAAGTAEACAATAGNSQVLGVATHKVVDDSTFVGTVSVEEADFLVVATSIAATDEGHVLYVVDDATVDETATVRIPAGVLVQYVGSTSGWVRMGPATKRNRSIVVSVNLALASLADGDILTNWTPGFAGVIKGMSYTATTASSTSAKLSTLNLEVGTTNVGACTLALTTALTDAMGEHTASSACTTGATFDEDDTISLEAASTTAFVEGAGVLLILIEEVN